MMAMTLVRASFGVLLFGTALHVSAQEIKGASEVTCMASYGWAKNSLQQSPCLVTAWLQAQCAGGTFTMHKLQPGFHYIGPSNDTGTQNPCICSTPVYMLESACGACQNRTFISWSNWKFYCPTGMLQDEGTYNQIIPSGTLVPHWAYLKPSDYSDFFDPSAAKLVGDTPESSQVSSSTISSTSTTSTVNATSSTTTSGATIHTSTTSTASSTSTSGGGGGGGTNTAAIAGGVVGGVFGLALLTLLGFWLLRNHNRPSPPSLPAVGAFTGTTSTGGAKSTQEMTAAGGHFAGGSNGGSGGGGATNGQYASSQISGPTAVAGGGGGGGGVLPPVGPVYNPDDPSTFPQPYGEPDPQPQHPAYGVGGAGLRPPPQQQLQVPPQGYYGGAPAVGAGGPPGGATHQYFVTPEV